MKIITQLSKLDVQKKNAPKAHCHNDILSVELWYSGKPIFIDPGTFCYTPNPEKRNYFRSNRNHNTVTINGEDYNDLNKGLFHVNWKTRSELNKWETNNNSIQFIGKNKLINGISIIRTIEYVFQSQLFIITDNVIGDINDNDKIRSNWHLHPDIKINKSSNNFYNNDIYLKFDHNQVCNTVDSFYSPQYGIIEKTQSIISRFIKDAEGNFYSKLIISNNNQS